TRTTTSTRTKVTQPQVFVNNSQRHSVRADQSTDLLRSQVPGPFGADLALEAADGLTGQRTKYAVQPPFVVTQALQRVLDPLPVRFGHSGLVRHGRPRRGWWGCWRGRCATRRVGGRGRGGGRS